MRSSLGTGKRVMLDPGGWGGDQTLAVSVLLAEWGEEGGQTVAVSVLLAQCSCLSGTLQKHCLFVVAAENSYRQWGNLED